MNFIKNIELNQTTRQPDIIDYVGCYCDDDVLFGHFKSYNIKTKNYKESNEKILEIIDGTVHINNKFDFINEKLSLSDLDIFLFSLECNSIIIRTIKEKIAREWVLVRPKNDILSFLSDKIKISNKKIHKKIMYSYFSEILPALQYYHSIEFSGSQQLDENKAWFESDFHDIKKFISDCNERIEI